MTRINVIPVNELSDQWLIAEYRELPRCVKQDIDTSDAPQRYKLGAGHMKWAKAHSTWLMVRYLDICEEMEYRGFTVNYPESELYKVWDGIGNIYCVSAIDITTNRKRLIEKYKMKPDFYKWTNREKPKWLEI